MNYLFQQLTENNNYYLNCMNNLYLLYFLKRIVNIKEPLNNPI
jgi:hypothetical protein